MSKTMFATKNKRKMKAVMKTETTMERKYFSKKREIRGNLSASDVVRDVLAVPLIIALHSGA